MTVHDAGRTCATLLVDLEVHPRVIMLIRRHAYVSMTLEIYANASPMATLRSAAQAGGSPFKCSFQPFPSGMTCGNFGGGDRILACGLFVPAKRCVGWGSPFDKQVKSSDLLRYLRYFAAVLAAREAPTNSGKGL